MTIRKTLTATVAAIALAATLAASTTPAEARYGRNAAAFGAFAIGALALGAIAANSAPVYEPACHIERQAVTNRWGDVIGFRRIRVCD